MYNASGLMMMMKRHLKHTFNSPDAPLTSFILWLLDLIRKLSTLPTPVTTSGLGSPLIGQ